MHAVVSLGFGRWRMPAGAFGFGCLILSCLTLPGAAAELADYVTPLFSGAGNCAFCHDQWGRALTDKKGRAVSIAADWRGTMMAHAFKDPLWRAVMEAEVAENPGLTTFIENKCQTCHAPAARAQARADGTNDLTFAAAKPSPLASEGVTCTLCHQVTPEKLGTPASFTGQFALGGEREIFGPYPDPVTMPMRRHVDYTPTFGAHTQESGLCGSCHTLFTPILDAQGKTIGSFPEQVPYLEWRNSDFARKGEHCQDCHLPRLNEPINISARPPWLGPREPFWRHQFAGGNAFMLTLLSRNAEPLDANAEPEQFAAMIDKSREQLRSAAKLRLSGKRERDLLTLRVEVENRAGHKFPTGHPYRRAWLHVHVSDKSGQTIFASGCADDQGRITGVTEPCPPHHDVITRPDQVQVYQAIMADAQGRPTFSLLRGAEYLKDNRLPPKGFAPQGEDAHHVAIRGVEDDPNFHAKQNGRDLVTYRIPLENARGPLVAEVELLYQAVPPEVVERLLKSSRPMAQEFTWLYRATDKAPEQVQRAQTKF